MATLVVEKWITIGALYLDAIWKYEMNIDKFKEAVAEFVGMVDLQFGIYLDSCAGFQEVHERTKKHQLELIEKLKVDHHQKANMEYLDLSYHFYGVGDPIDPNNILWHKVTQKQLKERTAKNGINEKAASGNCIVLIYEIWETEYRSRICEALSVKRNTMQIPIIGDLRWIRNAILHGKSRVTKEMNTKSEVLKWPREGQDFSFSAEQIYVITQKIKAAMDKLVEDKAAEDPKHRTIWHVQ